MALRKDDSQQTVLANALLKLGPAALERLQAGDHGREGKRDAAGTR